MGDWLGVFTSWFWTSYKTERNVFSIILWLGHTEEGLWFDSPDRPYIFQPDRNFFSAGCRVTDVRGLNTSTSTCCAAWVCGRRPGGSFWTWLVPCTGSCTAVQCSEWYDCCLVLVVDSTRYDQNDISPVPVSCCSMCASTGSVDGKSPCIRARRHQTSNTCTGTLYNLYFEVVPELTFNSHRSSFAWWFGQSESPLEVILFSFQSYTMFQSISQWSLYTTCMA